MVCDRAMLSAAIITGGPWDAFEVSCHGVFDSFAVPIRENGARGPEKIALNGPNSPQVATGIIGHLESEIGDRAGYQVYQEIPDSHCDGLCVFSVGPVWRCGFSIDDGA